MKNSALLILQYWSHIYLQLFLVSSEQLGLQCKGLGMEGGGWGRGEQKLL